MVRLGCIFLASSKKFLRLRPFLDSLHIHVKGGSGGMGIPRYGGIGGKGGDIYVSATEGAQLSSIIKEQPSKRFTALTGGNSRIHKILGEPGKNYTIRCPVGVTILADGGRKLGELDQVGSNLLVAKGGAGGGPNNQFNGQRGEARSITLDLKLIADVGLVGFPNAGKSSMLRGISRASPKVANYPFTTIAPNIGIIEYSDLRQISVADLPGLVEGAHGNIGLGHRFLKHVERTKILIFVVDINGFQLKPQTPLRTAFETIMILNKELELYREDLVDKPALLVVNKMDTDSENNFEVLLEDLRNAKEVTREWSPEFRPTRFIHYDDVIPTSATDGRNIDHLMVRIRELIDFNEELKRELNPSIRSVEVLLHREDGLRLS